MLKNATLFSLALLSNDLAKEDMLWKGMIFHAHAYALGNTHPGIIQ